MTWRVVAASEVGTSHVETGRRCEDSCWAQVDWTGDGLPFLSMFVSDGAGSASHGGVGAELAIQAAIDFISKECQLGGVVLNRELAVRCVLAIRVQLNQRVELERLKIRDFACTMLGVFSSPSGTLVLQIGDGAVVLDVGCGLETAIVPMSGEYANMTHFVTDEEAEVVLETKSYRSQIRRVAVFSDGLQRLVLDMTTNQPYIPFFDKFFQTMVEIDVDREGELHGALVKFLGSAAVNARSDDDKTLALAVLLS